MHLCCGLTGSLGHGGNSHLTDAIPQFLGSGPQESGQRAQQTTALWSLPPLLWPPEFFGSASCISSCCTVFWWACLSSPAGCKLSGHRGLRCFFLVPLSSTGRGHLWMYPLMFIPGGNGKTILGKSHDPGWREMAPTSGSLQRPQATLLLPTSTEQLHTHL